MSEWQQATIGEILEQANGNLRQRAEDWLADNPQVFALFEKFALRMVERRRKFGIGLLAERVRWEVAMTTEGDEYKVNNNYRAYIARKLVERHPEIGEFIDMRKVRF